MKVLHIPSGFYPDTGGGTEAYVAALTRHLPSYGFPCAIGAPGNSTSQYDYEGITVHRFGVTQGRVDLRSLYGEGDELAAQGFRKVLEAERPAVVHLHAFTTGASLKLVREAKRQGCKVVLTYHTPGMSCIQGRLWRKKGGRCDGHLNARQCTSCFARERGLRGFLPSFLSHLPPQAGAVLGKVGLQGGVWTALRLRELISIRQRAIRSLFQEVEHIVAVCKWVEDLLLRNGVPAHKITLCRHGLDAISTPGALNGGRSRSDDNGWLKIAWLGRIHPSKGLDLLIRALRVAPGVKCHLSAYGIVQDPASLSYLHELRQSAATDRRVTFHPALKPLEVVSALRQHDLLAVPSQCLETGPLVVLEAFAAGVPVIGSALGGVKELVRHEVDGLLVDPASEQAWAAVLQRCAHEAGLLARLRSAIRPPRSMRLVASEMASLYGSLT